jgi:hypothetical protein
MIQCVKIRDQESHDHGSDADPSAAGQALKISEHHMLDRLCSVSKCLNI